MNDMKINGVEKAAMFMMAINQDIAAKIFAMLEDDEIKEISQAMSSLGNINAESIEKVILEYSGEMNTTLSFVGNVQNTERFLRKIMGKEKVDVILEDIRGPAGRNIWDKLGNVNEEILANYLKNEYPQTTALILSKLSPAQSSKVLASFSSEFAFEVIKRMLTMDSVKKEVLERVEKTLRTEFISNLTKTQKYDNNQVMAEIFNNFDRTNESKFMELLEQHSIESAERIKSLMFTFDDMMKIDTVGIQAILKSIDKSRLALALKGTNEEVRKKFVGNMSQRAAKILLEEVEGMGPVRVKDVDEAQAEIITVAKDLINKGEIELSDGGDSDQLVY
ncbi:MAG: flagellar motor switch protein FliG [Rickettsiales bacterium]